MTARCRLTSRRRFFARSPDFLDRHNLDRRCHALLGSALQPPKKVEQFARVAADERVLRHLPRRLFGNI